MIAVIGIESEDPVRLLLDACSQKGIAWTMLNQRRQASWSIGYEAGQAGEAWLDNGDGRQPVAGCSGIYLRTMDHRKVPEWASSDAQQIEDMYAGLWTLLDDDELPARVVNAPRVQLSNNSKPYQSIVIQEHGFDIPESCITSDEAVARSFLEKHRSLIYKSISGARSIVSCVDDQSLANLSRLRFCPVQFQECVSGFNVRVHVVDDQAFATRICCEAIDYRYAAKEGKSATLEPFSLSGAVKEKCLRLAATLQLSFAGIDLMVADDGRTICFEVNPSPGYSYYERQTGQPISHALADYLAS
jgi:glutathione synthase/RimK-type ligase-like ATP-grasp enzyme